MPIYFGTTIVNIRIDNRSAFTCSIGWTVEEAETRIRSSRLLVGGELQKNGVVMRSTDLITSDGDYQFVNFQLQNNQLTMENLQQLLEEQLRPFQPLLVARIRTPSSVESIGSVPGPPPSVASTTQSSINTGVADR